MTYLFDTNIWIRMLKGRHLALLSRVARCQKEEIACCSTVRAELFYGAEKYDRPEKRKAQLADLLDRYFSLPFDDAVAERYGAVRQELEIRRCVIGPYDLQIAAIALVHGLVLVTGNVDEFSRVRGLRLEDWSV